MARTADTAHTPETSLQAMERALDQPTAGGVLSPRYTGWYTAKEVEALIPLVGGTVQRRA